jgi:hypothetical protein
MRRPRPEVQAYLIDYDGRRFSPAPAAGGPPTIARYHQDQELIWAEFGGGEVLLGSLAGTSAPDGELRFAYCMVRAGGEVVTGICRSVPEVLADGRIRLTEYWRRFGAGASSGISTLEELPPEPDSPLRNGD